MGKGGGSVRLRKQKAQGNNSAMPVNTVRWVAYKNPYEGSGHKYKKAGRN